VLYVQLKPSKLSPKNNMPDIAMSVAQFRFKT
jgi:hypothetical protein